MRKLVVVAGLLVPVCATAAYTPLVTTELTSGVQTDVQAAATFILTVAVVILAAGLIIRVFSR
jgi:hypothetical protein